MLVKTSGIVLHQIKFSDTGIIAHIYTEYAGRQSFLIQGIRSKSTSKKINLLQPLFLIDLEVYHRPGRELQKVKELKANTVFTSLPYHPVKMTITLFLAELLYKVLKEQESNPVLFSFLESSIQIFDIMEEGYNNFHMIFMLQLSRYLGFFPSNNYSEENNVFDLQNGIFTNIPPMHPYYLGPDISAHFSRLLSKGYQEELLSMNHAIRSKILDSILLYYSLHMSGMENFKSLEVLREVFHS